MYLSKGMLSGIVLLASLRLNIHPEMNDRLLFSKKLKCINIFCFTVFSVSYGCENFTCHATNRSTQPYTTAFTKCTSTAAFFRGATPRPTFVTH